MHLFGETADDYRAFVVEAADSPTFAAWAAAVAEDAEVLARLEELPPLKRQPNLLFAAARWHGVPAPGPYAALRAAVLGEGGGAIRETMLTRRTQTNEAGRMAVLAPVLARVQREDGRPIALVEVGASAGLCLYPDRYDYRWEPAGQWRGPGGPELSATTSGPVPVPTARCGSRRAPGSTSILSTSPTPMPWPG